MGYHPSKTIPRVLNFGEFFCGPGGLALGAKMANSAQPGARYTIKHTWATDYDADACATYAHNIAPDSPDTIICVDVRNLDYQHLSPIDIFSFGFPCNDFSVVGEHRGFKGEFGPLYVHGVRLINRFKPLAFLAENVGGIRSVNEGTAFKQILQDLEHSGDGYNLTAHFYKFEEYGVPQARHRVIIVGIAKHFNLEFAVPAPLTANNPPTVLEALTHPPIPKDAPNNEFTHQSEKVVERLIHIKPGQNIWTADIPVHLRLNVKTTRMSQIYKRLDPNKPSYTITGSGGGGTHVYHWSEPRALTNRERARIQTFPDNFVFMGGKESVRKQIGMAVPPRVAQIVFEALLNTLAEINYNWVSANLYTTVGTKGAFQKQEMLWSPELMDA